VALFDLLTTTNLIAKTVFSENRMMMSTAAMLKFVYWEYKKTKERTHFVASHGI
jgi:hypothetical protein